MFTSRKIIKTLSSGFVSASLLVLFSVGYSPATFAKPECSSAVVDTDGDGWGFENNTSCVMAVGHAACSSSAILNGDGWGYDNGRACIDSRGVSLCTANASDSGNGWGWENNASCRYVSSRVNASTTTSQSSSSSTSSSSSSASSSRPSCTSAAISNGDGWGWENNTSCRYRGDTPTTSTSSSSNGSSATYNSNGARECSAAAADTGSGWGFEFGESCIWGSVQPLTDRNSVIAAPPPVTVAAIGYENGDPICLTDASDGNADGFGYENDRSCRVVDGRTATSSDPLLNTRWCQPWAEISYGDYVLQNNTWNSSDVYSNNWSQCIELTGWTGNYIAKWDYNWLDKDEGNDFSVKSYPQVFYGRKTSNSQSGTPEKLGLPVNVNQLPDYKVRYRYSETGAAERNVALESFFHTSCDAEEYNKHFEMMVWVGKPVIKTPGTKVTEATIDNKVWDVYINPALSWGYVAFVEQTPSTQGWLAWKDFVDWTRFQGPSYGIWDVGNTCMGAIEIGTETFWGNGTFTLDEFRVTR